MGLPGQAESKSCAGARPRLGEQPARAAFAVCCRVTAHSAGAGGVRYCPAVFRGLIPAAALALLALAAASCWGAVEPGEASG